MEPVRTRAARVAVIVVTWNRKDVAEQVLRAIAQQAYPHDLMHVTVVDNGSTDGTVEHLARTYRPERIVENRTERAHEPAFETGLEDGRGNTPGFASLTIVRNQHNLGGCGGFNTGFAFVERFVSQWGEGVDYVWLVDDDVDLPSGSLERLVATADSDGSIGLVGSRAVSFHDRTTTIESTVYFDFERGRMGDAPTPGHPLEPSHRAWVESVGGTKGTRDFRGVRDVDVVSACSLLARWKAVERVGYWDHRFFIYCDDADWSLRFKRAGYRVVCDLEAVVYHTPWFDKLTPTRLYYAQRNVVWVLQKSLSGWRLRRATALWMMHLMWDSLRAGFHRRLFHAEIIRRTAMDIACNRGGKLAYAGPPRQEAARALDEIGALRGDRSVVFLCTRERTPAWAMECVRRVREYLGERSRESDEPSWIAMVRNDVQRGSMDGVRVVEYGGRLRSRLRRQWPLVLRPPRVVVVFDQINDVPLVRGAYNVHVDWKDPSGVQVERDGVARRAAFLWKWGWTGARVMAHACTVQTHRSATKYG